MQLETLYNLFLQFPSVQTDTRKIKEGDLFFALKGPNFNGNLFAEEAIKMLVDADYKIDALEKYFKK